MSAQFLAVLTSLLLQYAPGALTWAVHGFISTVRGYLDKYPAAAAAFDTLAKIARGIEAGDGAHAPDELKKWLLGVLDGAKSTIRNPMLRSLFTTVESFVVDNLADQLWSELFSADSEHPNGLVMAVRPFPASECGPWHHSLVVAAAAVGDKWADLPDRADPEKPAAESKSTPAA